MDPDDWTPADPEALYRQLMAQDPQSTLPRFSLAKLCVEHGRFPEALDLLRSCVALQANWAAAWLLLGDALAGAADKAGAREAYAKCRAAALAQRHGTLAAEADEKSDALND